MEIFRKEKMKYREIIKELDIRIANFLNSRKIPMYEIDSHTGNLKKTEMYCMIQPVGEEMATLEIGGYLSSKTIKKIGKYYSKKGYLLKISLSNEHLTEKPFFLDFDHPEKVEKITVMR